jgi:hypothetical protein
MGIFVFLGVLAVVVIGFAYLLNAILFWTIIVSLCVLSLALTGLYFLNKAVDPADLKRGP